MEKQGEKKSGKYDGVSVTDLETKIEKLHVMSRESQKEMFECLEYLRTTYRFKENARYKKSSFWEYLEDRFAIRQGTYRKNVRAFTKFPEYAVEYGVGMVTKIEQVCGGMRVDKVISEIQQGVAAHKTSLSRGKIEAIIQRHRAVPKIEKKVTDWHAMYEHEKAAHEKTKEALRVATRKNKELNEQNEKLKATVQTVKNIRKLVGKYDRPAQLPAAL